MIPYSGLPDDLAALADESVDPEELTDLVRRRQPHHQDPIGDLDPAEAAAQDGARNEEGHETVLAEPHRDAADDQPDRP